jgi:hypothetical protein
MLFTDLTDTKFDFLCELAEEEFINHNYYFKIVSRSDNCIREYDCEELHQLRQNCEKILSATKFIKKGE